MRWSILITSGKRHAYHDVIRNRWPLTSKKSFVGGEAISWPSCNLLNLKLSNAPGIGTTCGFPLCNSSIVMDVHKLWQTRHKLTTLPTNQPQTNKPQTAAGRTCGYDPVCSWGNQTFRRNTNRDFNPLHANYTPHGARWVWKWDSPKLILFINFHSFSPSNCDSWLSVP